MASLGHNELTVHQAKEGHISLLVQDCSNSSVETNWSYHSLELSHWYSADKFPEQNPPYILYSQEECLRDPVCKLRARHASWTQQLEHGHRTSQPCYTVWKILVTVAHELHQNLK